MVSLDIYDEAFFDGIDGVTNALDNIQARELHFPGILARS